MKLAQAAQRREADAVATVKKSLAAAEAERDFVCPSQCGAEAALVGAVRVLAPETLVTIEESLNTVNAAIEEIETALADDPNSDLLLRMLATHRSTKLGVLQRAAAAVQAQV